jgi:hypothetical protein
MTDDEIRKRVRERLANGMLPRHIPAGPVTPGQPSPPLIVTGSALPNPCEVYDEPATQMRYELTTGSLAFHDQCGRIWDEERYGPIPRELKEN